jgi:hypothetical protein
MTTEEVLYDWYRLFIVIEALHPSTYHKVCHLFAIEQSDALGFHTYNERSIGSVSSICTVASSKSPPGPISAALMRMLKELIDASGHPFNFDPSMIFIDMVYHPAVLHNKGASFYPVISVSIDVPFIFLEGITMTLHQYVQTALHQEYFKNDHLKYTVFFSKIPVEIVKEFDKL